MRILTPNGSLKKDQGPRTKDQRPRRFLAAGDARHLSWQLPDKRNKSAHIQPACAEMNHREMDGTRDAKSCGEQLTYPTHSCLH
jgi:hypothetical protein